MVNFTASGPLTMISSPSPPPQDQLGRFMDVIDQSYALRFFRVIISPSGKVRAPRPLPHNRASRCDPP